MVSQKSFHNFLSDALKQENPNRGGGSQGPPDPDLFTCKSKIQILGGGGPGPHDFEIQILFW